jgi:hypothetical protein
MEMLNMITVWGWWMYGEHYRWDCWVVPDGIYWVGKEWEGWLCGYGVVECGYLVKVLNVYLMECWVCTKLECWAWVPSRDVEYVYQVKCWLCTGWECCNVLRRVLWYCPFKNLNMESCVLLFLTMASGGVECCFFSLPPPPHTRPQLYILSTMTVYR